MKATKKSPVRGMTGLAVVITPVKSGEKRLKSGRRVTDQEVDKKREEREKKAQGRRPVRKRTRR